MRTVVLLLLGIHLASAVTHSMKYILTGVSEIDNFPEYTAVGMVDDVPFVYFDSNIKRMIPKTEWIKENEGADYWNRESQRESGWMSTFKASVQILMDRYKQTSGVHTWQTMYGCELNDDGTTQGFYQFGYDGADFVSLDKKTLTWTAANPEAVITKNKWEADRAYTAGRKEYLENKCIESIKKYVGYGKDTLERKVSPQVSLLQKDPSSSVTCHATGFFPSGVKISWQKNGQDHDEDVDLGELLPNEDGTFQRMSTLNVGPDEWKKNKFSCVVEHQDKTIRKTEDDIITNLDSVPIAIIVGSVAAVILVIVIGVVGYLVYQRNKGFKPVSASDDGSNSSART